MQRIIQNWLYGHRHPETPSYVTFFVNNICQLRCDMCFYWDAMQKETKQLSLSEIDKVSRSLPNLLQLSLTGGEPSLRKDLADVVGIFCRNSNVARCSINTNGMLSDRIYKQVDTFVKENPDTEFRVSISIDGDEKLHDKIRGVKGSYGKAKRTMSKLRTLDYKNLQLDVCTTISTWNWETFFTYVKEIERDFDPDIYVVNYTRGITKEEGADDIPPKAYSKISEYVRNKKRKSHLLIKTLDRTMLEEIDRIVNENTFKYYCTAGKKLITIYEDGRVMPCEVLQTMKDEDFACLGSLETYNYNVQTLLNRQRAVKLKNWIKDEKCFCTFECARSNDVAFNKQYGTVLIKNFWKEVTNV